jgi:hypothetical protein
MHRMPESTARLDFPHSADFLGVALDSTRFFLRKYRIQRRPADWVRRVLEKGLAPEGRRSHAPARARLELKAHKSILKVTLRIPASHRAAARLRTLLSPSLPGAGATIRSLNGTALVILTLPIPEDR